MILFCKVLNFEYYHLYSFLKEKTNQLSLHFDSQVFCGLIAGEEEHKLGAWRRQFWPHRTDFKATLRQQPLCFMICIGENIVVKVKKIQLQRCQKEQLIKIKIIRLKKKN